MRLTRIPNPFHPSRFHDLHPPLIQFTRRILPRQPQQSARPRFQTQALRNVDHRHRFPKMSANTTTTPQPGLPTPAQLLEPLTTDLSTATTTTTPGTDDAVQAAVQGFTDRLLRAAAAQPPQAQVQDTETQTQTQTQTPAEEHRKESIAHFVWTAYNDLLDAAQRTPPARQGRLLDFVERLRETVVKGEDGQVLVYEGGELWEGLPSLGWVVRDRWNFDSSDPKTTAEQRTEWENLNAFVAQLTTRADGDDPLDFTLLGLWVMRDAFEAENGVGSDTAVRVASLWVRFAGPLLRELSSNGLDFSAKLGVAEGKYADRGWKGFNDERWEAWGDELKVAQAKLASDETVQGAAKAMAGVL